MNEQILPSTNPGEVLSESTSQLPAERLSLLYNLSQTFNSSLDLEEVLNMVMDEVISATNAERGFVVLHTDNHDLDFRAARGIDQNTLADPEFQISRGVVQDVIQSGEPVLTSDAQSDERFSGRQSVINLRLRSILCAPLKVKENILGAIYVDNRLHVGLFTQADLDLLSAIAASAAIAIENARLYQVAVEKGRMERDLQLAYKVQSSLLPHETPSYGGWEFATRWIPAREVAGDFFDFFPLGDGELGIVIADVADKGIASALFMASCRSVIRGSMLRASSPQDGINSANRLIHADATDGNFLTLFYAQLNPESGEMVYVNAGHNPPLLVRRGADVLQKLTLTGMALGVIEDFNYEQRAINLNPGDMIFLFTDGVSEAVDIDSAEFGEARLEKFVLDNQEQTAEDLAASLETTLEVFTASTQPFDDITIVVIKRTSAS